MAYYGNNSYFFCAVLVEAMPNVVFLSPVHDVDHPVDCLHRVGRPLSLQPHFSPFWHQQAEKALRSTLEEHI